MLSDRLVRRSLRALLGGLAMTTTLPSTYAQDVPCGQPMPSCRISPFYPQRRESCVPCCPSSMGTVVPYPSPSVTPSPNPNVTPNPNPAVDPALPSNINEAMTGTGARGDGEVGLSAPNIMGNLLGAGSSVAFFVNRASGAVFVNGTGSTTVVNTKVAENNSPIPADRVYFRYNYFNNAEAITGLSSQPPFFDPSIQSGRQLSTTKKYDVNQFTFGVEKTFFDGLFSVEVRVPFSDTLSHDLNLNYGNITGIGLADSLPGAQPVNLPAGLANPNANAQSFLVNSNPSQTLGNSSTEFGDMTLIAKAELYRTQTFLLSGGAALLVPTGPDTHVQVTDYLGFGNLDAAQQRVRTFNIKDQTFSMSPFLAFLVKPSDRFFFQGFTQFEIPLNESDVSYSNVNAQTVPIPGAPFSVTRGGRVIIVNGDPNYPSFPNTPAIPGAQNPPINVNTHIREQALMHVDISSGYWLYRNPEATWLTGFAPSVELHYTHSLNSPEVITLPQDGSHVILPNSFQTGALGIPPAPTIGSLRGNVDILDLTVGTTFELGNKATVATGFSFPLRNGNDKTYDWEFQLQLNYYFGRVR